MRRLIVLIALLLALGSATFAQNTQIVASHIDYFGGAPVTGAFCLTPTNQVGQPINLVTSTGQQIAPKWPLCYSVVTGALASNAIVPDTSLSQPTNACYLLTVLNREGQTVATYPCVQPSGSTWSFDGYVPDSLPAIPALTMPQYYTNGVLNQQQGALNFVCTGCSNSGSTITIPVGGGNTNENLSYSPTPSFSVSYSSSRITLSGNIAFTLDAGSDGQSKCLEFTHDATSTAYVVSPPVNVFGFMNPIGAVASKRNQQCFTYFVSDSAWLAQSPGVINQ
jgi:hypothetical protein